MSPQPVSPRPADATSPAALAPGSAGEDSDNLPQPGEGHSSTSMDRPLQFLPSAQRGGPNPVLEDPGTDLIPRSPAGEQPATEAGPGRVVEPLTATTGRDGAEGIGWNERRAVAEASRAAADLPCPGEEAGGVCEHVDLVLPPEQVHAPDPSTFLITLTVRIATTTRPTEPSEPAASHVSGCSIGGCRFQRLEFRVERGDTGPVVIHLESEPDDVAVPQRRE